MSNISYDKLPPNGGGQSHVTYLKKIWSLNHFFQISEAGHFKYGALIVTKEY